jgi:phosphatidylserine decarboxylase
MALMVFTGWRIFDFSDYFTIFRNPKRAFILNENHILAPVDGKVVVIEEVRS